jgi:type I restriction enzyme S subunit
MSDSGVDWIGEVPRHWFVTRLGYFATVENGTTPSKEKLEYWTDGQIPWLASGEVNQLRIVEANEFITEQALADSSLRLLPEGTVVVGLVGQGKTRGMSAILSMAATINQNLAAICPGPKIDSEYVFYLFQAMYVSLREDGRGGNQAAINCKMLAALQIPVPPIQEQQVIAAFLNTLSEETNTLESESNGAIKLLQEHRSALISAAVAGKIDVRNYPPKGAA